MFKFIAKYFQPELSIIRQRRLQALKSFVEANIAQNEEERIQRVSVINVFTEQLKLAQEENDRINADNKAQLKELVTTLQVVTESVEKS